MGPTFTGQRVQIRVAESLPGADDPTSLRLTVLVYDYAGLTTETRLQAEQEATRIFDHSGIELVWQHCLPVDGPRERLPDSCRASSATITVLRLVKEFRCGKTLHADVMGWTTGPFATISIRKAQQLAHDRNGPLSQVLGHAIAHELGHRLLPCQIHSAVGIMRTHWDLKDWENLSHGWLLFTPEQSKALRHSVSLRQSVSEHASSSMGQPVVYPPE